MHGSVTRSEEFELCCSSQETEVSGEPEHHGLQHPDSQSSNSSSEESGEAEAVQDDGPDMTPDDMADDTYYQDEMDQDIQARNNLWDHEIEIRLRTSECTQLESKRLREISSCLYERLRDDGLKPGNLLAQTWLSQRLQDLELDFVPGQPILMASSEWSLAKIQLLAARQVTPRTDGGPACHCLPASGFFPSGCPHKGAVAAYGTSCRECCKCLRCGKACKKFLLSASLSCSCRAAGLVGDEFRH